MSEFIKQEQSEHGQLEIAKAIRSLAGDPYTKPKIVQEFSDGISSRAGQSAIASAIRSLAGDTFDGVPDKQEFINKRASEEGQEEIIDAILYLAGHGGIGGDPKLQEVSVPPNQQSLSEVVIEPEEGYDGLEKVVIPKLVDKTVTPTTFSRTVQANNGEGYGLRKVTVEAIPSTYQKLNFLFASTNSNAPYTVTFSAPNTFMSEDIFRGLTAINNLTLDNAKEIGKNSFLSVKHGGGNGLTVTAPKVSVIGTNAFKDSDVKSVSIGNINNDGISYYIQVESKAFSGCTKLEHLYLKWSTPVRLTNVDAFEGASSLLTVHVPENWLNFYESDTNWSAVENIMFVGETFT